MAYCNEQSVIDRLSNTGILFIADDDEDNTLDTNEMAFVSQAILDTSTEIDVALATVIDLPIVGTNLFLQRINVDLAAERLCERKGGEVPAGILAAANRARTWLSMIMKKQIRVPGITYPQDLYTKEDLARRLPKIVNRRGTIDRES
ncbi:MAG: DUF1320 domain-containing protein [Candidatus Obscuribacterales bacterium]|nr:DUF1320 domain-containing protein [Candidatus Obscuribacterales bacterium]